MFVLGYQVLGIIVYLIIQNGFAQAALQQQLPYIENTWWLSSIIYMTFFGAGLLIRTLLFNKVYKITITDEMFEGQGFLSKPKISKPLKMIDRERTMQKHFFNKVFWFRNIWFIDGKSFELHEYAFRADEVRMILKKIGCE